MTYHIRQGTAPSYYRGNTQAPQYHYSYSYQYPWVRLPENLIDSCAFNAQEGIRLTSRRLEIHQKHLTRIVELHRLRSLSLHFRRLMLPILVGGVMAPITIVAISARIMSSGVGLAVCVLCLLLIYYGYRGRHQLMLHLQGSEQSIFLDDYQDDLATFVERANRYLRKRQKRP